VFSELRYVLPGPVTALVAIHENSSPFLFFFFLPFFCPSFFSFFPFFSFLRTVRAEKIGRKTSGYRRRAERFPIPDRGGGEGRGVGEDLAPERGGGEIGPVMPRKGLRARLYGTNFTLRCRNSRESAVVFASFLPFFFPPFFFSFSFLFFSFLFFSFPSFIQSFLTVENEALRVAAIRDWARAEGLSCHKFHAEPGSRGERSLPPLQCDDFCFYPFFPQTPAENAGHALMSGSLSGPDKGNFFRLFHASMLFTLHRAICIN